MMMLMVMMHDEVRMMLMMMMMMMMMPSLPILFWTRVLCLVSFILVLFSLI